jgi:hypothetical protein
VGAVPIEGWQSAQPALLSATTVMATSATTIACSRVHEVSNLRSPRRGPGRISITTMRLPQQGQGGRSHGSATGHSGLCSVTLLAVGDGAAASKRRISRSLARRWPLARNP